MHSNDSFSQVFEYFDVQLLVYKVSLRGPNFLCAILLLQKKLGGVVPVPTVVGFNVKHLCQRVENTLVSVILHSIPPLSLHPASRNKQECRFLSPHNTPLLLPCLMIHTSKSRTPVSIVCFSFPLCFFYCFPLHLFVAVHFSDLVPVSFILKNERTLFRLWICSFLPFLVLVCHGEAQFLK